MNKLILTEQGGQRITRQDLDFIQQSTIEAFQGILSGLKITQHAVILSGCQVTGDGSVGNPLTVAAGYISYKNEVMKVDAYAYPEGVVPAGALCWAPEITYGDQVPFKNLTLKDVRQIRKCVLTGDTGLTDFVLISATARIEEVIALMVNNDTWHEVGAVGEPVYQAGYSAGTMGGIFNPLRFKKNRLGQLIFSGKCVKASGNQNTHIFTLPAGYIPPKSQERFFTTTGVGEISLKIWGMSELLANRGKVALSYTPGTGQLYVSLDGWILEMD